MPLERLTTEVSETVTVMESARVFIVGLAQQLRDAKQDPVQIAALADELDAKQAELAQAILDNTPAEPEPT